MHGPPTAARRAQALEEVVDDVVGWRHVARQAVTAARGAGADAGRHLEGIRASMAEAADRAQATDRSVDDAVGGAERWRREAEEAGTGIRFRGERVDDATRYVERTVVRWRAVGGRPLQLADLGNAAARQAARRLDGCHPSWQAGADRARSASIAVSDAVASSAAAREALTGAGRARARGERHLEALRSSGRVDAASDEAWRQTQRSVTRLTDQHDALRRYDEPAEWAP